jgi:predicted nucleic acid-binding protein
MYVDTSVLVAYYLPEPQSEEVQKRLQQADDRWISQLTVIELLSALNKKVRMGELAEQDSKNVFRLFKKHLKTGIFRMYSYGPELFMASEYILQTTTAPLRTLDAQHLSLVYEEGLSLYSLDEVMNEAAKELGVLVC